MARISVLYIFNSCRHMVYVSTKQPPYSLLNTLHFEQFSGSVWRMHQIHGRCRSCPNQTHNSVYTQLEYLRVEDNAEIENAQRCPSYETYISCDFLYQPLLLISSTLATTAVKPFLNLLLHRILFSLFLFNPGRS